MQNTRSSTVFGKRREPHTVIIARGNEIRHFTVRPWVAATLGSVLSAVAVGYLLATSYLVLRDDLIGASIARQARVQQAYEDRIAALRSQVDRITSRQLLDQQLMETKVSELLQRQSQLSRRHGRLGPILERAESELPAEAPAPEQAKPDQRADAAAAAAPDIDFSYWNTRSAEADVFSDADKADRLFSAINRSLRSIETEQIDRVTTLAADADRTADAIADALESAGLSVEKDDGKTGLGGPFVAVDDKAMFDTRVNELDEALGRLETMKKAALSAPIHNPAPGYGISSSFGVRRDPLIGAPAMHAGIDFRVPYGNFARSTGVGTVVKAGWNGGYGRMVEIDHGDGLTTRYAHLSKILVKVGDHVERGGIVGKTGSSGRSTGPHLHYEMRRNGTAIDPLRFIKVGKKVAALL